VHSFNTLLWVSYFWIFGQWVLNFDGLRAQYCLGFELCFGFCIKRAKHDLAWVFQKNPKQIQKQLFPNIALVSVFHFNLVKCLNLGVSLV
jgi:hypothetical protein